MGRWIRVDGGANGRPGQLRQWSDNPKKWQVRVFVGLKPNGKKGYRAKTVCGTKRQALDALNEMHQQKRTGLLAPRTAVKLEQLIPQWLEHKRREVSPRTLTGYRDALTWYVLPTLGRRRIEDITLREIDALYGAMSDGSLPEPTKNEEGETVGWRGGALSPRTVRITHTALHQCLNQAVKWGWIPFNPAAAATLPRGRRTNKRALTQGEREAFIAASQGAYYCAFFRVLMDTGMRPGEACALRWTDIDLDAETISITKAVTRGSDGEPVVAAPKTSQSARVIPLFGLGDLLKERRAAQVRSGQDALGTVFTNQQGGLLAPFTFNMRELERTAKAAGITWNMGLYTFRHTFATLHMALGRPATVIAAWMGHATTDQTQNTYQHVSQELSLEFARQSMTQLAEQRKPTVSGAEAN